MVAYAELHCHSNFSFLDGASHPEELAEEAARLGLAALAVTDHDGFYGVVRFAHAARECGLPTVFGTELTLGIDAPAERDPRSRRASTSWSSPRGRSDTPASPGRSARRSSRGRRARPAPPSPGLAATAARRCAPRSHRRECRERLVVRAHRLSQGHRAGGARRATVRPPPGARSTELVDAFGRDRVLVELWDHGDPLDRHRNDALARSPLRAGIDVVATNNVHYATPAQRPLATALAAVRAAPFARRARRLAPRRPARAPAQSPPSRRAASLAGRARWSAPSRSRVPVRFDLHLAAPELPDHDVPPGTPRCRWLRELAARGAAVRVPAARIDSTRRRCTRSSTSST